jgi:protease-4
MQPANNSEKKKTFAAWAGRFFYRFFFVAGVAATISVVLLVMTISRIVNYAPPSLPDKILLTYTFKSGLHETAGPPSLSQPLLRPPVTLEEVTTALSAASRDARVKGFVADIRGMDLNFAQVQEVRDAVAAFRKSGKFAMIYNDSFGGTGSGMMDYYLASSFDEIWMQPVGMVAISGIAAEVPFARGILDKVGATAQFVHKGRYKSAPESMTAREMSADNREMMNSLIGDMSGQLVADIAASRNMQPEILRGHMNRALFSDAEALSAKLIDKVGYYGDMVEEAEKKAGGDMEKNPVNLLGYTFIQDTADLNKGMSGFVSKLTRKEGPPSSYKNKSKIALIFGSGDIVPYRGSGGFGQSDMDAESVVEAFEAAQKDKDVAAVVFRVDSPGGAPNAAETIRHAVIETQKAGKPVIVSMGGYAASGGYWVATHADKIVAQPGTVTGSIGVFGGKIVLDNLWKKLDMNWEIVADTESAGMWSVNRPFTEKELARFENVMGSTYNDFITRVMEGRKMTKAQVEAVAEGRVFTGRQAKANGLVDELGGLDRAIDVAKQVAKIDATAEIPVIRFPPRKSTLEMFIELATEGAWMMPMTFSTESLSRLMTAQSLSRMAPVSVR